MTAASTAADRFGPQRQAYSPGELADIIGTSRAFVYDRMADGTIPSVKIGRRRLIPRAALDSLLELAPVGGDAA